MPRKSTNTKKKDNKAKLNFFDSWLKIIIIFITSITLYLIISSTILFFVVRSKELVVVPKVTETYFLNAFQSLSDRNLGAKLQTKFITGAPRGWVVEQSPHAGRLVKEKSKIKLTVSRGPALVKVPKLVHLNIDMARQKLLNIKIDNQIVALPVGSVVMVRSEEYPKNIVIAQDPPADSEVSIEEPINLLVSEGKKEMSYYFEDYKGQKIDFVIQRMFSYNIRVKYSYIYNIKDRNKNGTIIKQLPELGTKIKALDTVRFFVALDDSIKLEDDGYHKITYKLPKSQLGKEVKIIIENGNPHTWYYNSKTEEQDISFIYKRSGISILKVYVNAKLFHKEEI